MTEKKLLNYEQTKEKALRLLEFRAHSEFELTEKLKRAGATDGDIEKTLDFCREYGFVNDEQYAKRKAADLQKLKKYGRHRIAAELKHNGISGDLIEAALDDLDEDEENILYPLVAKRLGGNFERKNIEKCIRYFTYRGYGFGDIKACVERAEEEAGDEI